MNWPETLRQCFDLNAVVYSTHARREMRNEEFGTITDQEVYEAVCDAEVVETYPDDKPYASVLILGMTTTNRPLHLVCAYNDAATQTIVITVYEPDPSRWENYRRRK